MGRLILHSGFWTLLWNIFSELSWVPLTTPWDGSGCIVIYKPLFGVASLFLTLKCKSPWNNYLPQLLLGCEKDFIFSKQPEAFVPKEESTGALPQFDPSLNLKEGSGKDTTLTGNTDSSLSLPCSKVGHWKVQSLPWLKKKNVCFPSYFLISAYFLCFANVFLSAQVRAGLVGFLSIGNLC